LDIIQNTDSRIKKYLNDFKDKKLKKPDLCGVCGKKSNLSWHAIYTRNVITLVGAYCLPIKRLFCPLCKHTFAFIPDFICKFHRYAKDVITFALKKLKKLSYKKVADLLAGMLTAAGEIYIDVITLYNWKKKFSPA
jgi:hypothetical protein